MPYHLKDIPNTEVLLHQHRWRESDYKLPRTHVLLGEKYGSQKLVAMKMEKLIGLGYMECGVSAVTGWLTPKGLKLLTDTYGAEILNEKT